MNVADWECGSTGFLRICHLNWCLKDKYKLNRHRECKSKSFQTVTTAYAEVPWQIGTSRHQEWSGQWVQRAKGSVVQDSFGGACHWGIVGWCHPLAIPGVGPDLPQSPLPATLWWVAAPDTLVGGGLSELAPQSSWSQFLEKEPEEQGSCRNGVSRMPPGARMRKSEKKGLSHAVLSWEQS